jgi:hypothetical protein
LAKLFAKKTPDLSTSAISIQCEEFSSTYRWSTQNPIWP